VVIVYQDIGPMMLTILVNFVTTLVKLVLVQVNANVLFVIKVTTYITLVVLKSVHLDIMPMKLPKNVNFVTDLVLVVSILQILVVDVMLVNTYITMFVITLAQLELITLKTQPQLVKTVTKDVLSVKTKPMSIVMNVTIHGYSTKLLV
jgi:hypothetical protein